jgi:DNA-binding Lrp family transcriptional regulator
MSKQNYFFPFDKLDYQIIQCLNKNARASASEIARDVDANERTVRKRIDRLVESGVIRLTAVVDPQVLGYAISVDVFLEINPDLENEILPVLLDNPHVTYLAYGQGTKEISIEARFKNNEDMQTYLRQILPSIPGVSVSGFALVPGIIRNIDEWMPPPEDFGIDKDS